MFCMGRMLNSCLLIEIINTLRQNCLCLKDRVQAVVLKFGRKNEDDDNEENNDDDDGSNINDKDI